MIPMLPSSLRRHVFSLLALGTLALAGCASWNAANDESLLSAAGFQTKTPSTAKQQAFYNALPPFSVEREVIKGKPVYVYADKKNGIVYFGGEAEYQRYKALGLKQSIAEENLMAADMEQQDEMDWGVWGPIGFW